MKIIQLESIEKVKVNHESEITKQVFLKKGEIPNLMMFSTSTFKAGDSVETHKHDTMFEVFFIQKGTIEFVVNGHKSILKEGDCITIAPKELHSQNNPFQEEAVLLYFGISTESNQ